MNSESAEEELRRRYITPGDELFAARWKQVKKQMGERLTNDEIRRILAEQSDAVISYRREKFDKNSYVVPHLRYLAEMDLYSCARLKKENDGITFHLLVIDTFSRFLFVRALKSKKGPEVAAALDSILTGMSSGTPLRINSDRGR